MNFLLNSTFKMFKVSLLSCFMILWGCQSKSQEGAKTQVAQNINTKEVTWNPSISDALAAAKGSGKLLFVECYSPTCPVCISMEPFFKNSEVATKFNSSFVNYKLDVGVAEQVKFLNERKIYLPSFPQFLFFDGDGNLVHQAEVVTEVKSFINAADAALNTDKRANTYAERFKKGEKSLDFLVSTASFARVTRDTMLNINAANELFNIYPKDQLGSETSWKLTKKCVADIDNGFAKYWFDHVNVASEMEKKDGHAGNENNILGGIIQASLYSPRGKTYSSAKINEVKKYMAKSGAGEYADGVTWEYEANALIREGKLDQALAIGQKTANKFANNGQSLVYITKVFNDAYPNVNYIKNAKAWLALAKANLKEDQYLAEYFFESARVSLKEGNKAAAKAAGQQAQSYAVKAKKDLAKFTDLMSKI